MQMFLILQYCVGIKTCEFVESLHCLSADDDWVNHLFWEWGQLALGQNPSLTGKHLDQPRLLSETLAYIKNRKKLNWNTGVCNLNIKERWLLASAKCLGYWTKERDTGVLCHQKLAVSAWENTHQAQNAFCLSLLSSSAHAHVKHAAVSAKLSGSPDDR